MADENVIVIEENNETKNKKPVYIIIILLLLLLIMLLVLLLVVVKNKEKKDSLNINKIVKKLEKKNLPKDELKILIKKANILFKSGKKEQALNLLEKVSNYSKSLSLYNLGVIQIKEKNYKKALYYFQQSIKNQHSKALSAINAAFCALMLKDKKLFDYYKNLAYIYLPTLAKNKNYPYYYALVMYYNGYEYNSLLALKNANNFKSNELLSAIYEYFNNPFRAAIYTHNPFYKGIEYAQIGEYALARNYLKEVYSPKSEFALALVDLKLGYFKEASSLIKKYKNKNIYPIFMFLKPSLFSVKTAQKDFKKSFLANKKDYYDLFFYYAPYKVFNMNQTIEFLQKGIAGIPLGAIEESSNALSKSAFYSKMNIDISKAVKLALNGHIYLANKKFKELYKKRKDSYIINYNLALTYAQLGDYVNAYKHFLKAYHLNPYDLKSGIFALYSGDKLGIKNPFLLASIKEDLNDKTKLQSAMLALYTSDKVKLASFLDEDEKNNPMWIVTALSAKAFFNKDYTLEALKLKSMFDKDLVSNILYFYAENKNLPLNKLAAKYIPYFFTLNKNLNDFFYGSKLAREWYFDFARISGLMERVREILIKKAKLETKDIIPVLQRLAFANIYTKHFEEAYTIYNDLIENKHINDPRTLYYAAVAAIGANHHANAVALMELAKLKNPKYPEPRFALGLLWQEAGNLNAASIQYSKIPDFFKSEFFDFDIKKP